jgi:thiamine-monophosphate kinase
MLVRKTDMPPGMSFREAARKTVAMCVSDFAAKGARPDSFLVSLGVPRGTTEAQIKELARGFKDASIEWRVKLIGGDTNEADDLVIDCVMAGFAENIVTRSGARPGELVVTTGYFGYPPSGLRVLMENAHATKDFRDRAVRSVFHPVPNLELGLGLARYMDSSMDSSDGLAICLHTIADMSHVGITLDQLPVKRDVRKFARENHLQLNELVFGGGEEYLIVGTIKREHLEKARECASAAGGVLLVLGQVTREVGKVVIQEEHGRTTPIGRIGWTHLS